mmetsp:Transcript_32905/g.70590  ORF Transcript_32905/g.70590 Transcript_32905/m.70590 type:complete len:514 (-) Transcript_32905:102-1643(-)|eukprot:CAMPEP_0206459434 /NCGR_PEP_ID=MMETSP0324_2-20121206/24170_1 /ASSEMBLY_ACC=CAM_ASM_000836 /TAXON_ID=2866 /ORGANISM="Crypthecodinium cohnii, Strain Seligo" /LENGTH=513 /DNA_ID=CAMNT_0053930977 /DNA_START=154 /DNA_END=1695 /DNA_ORIENTATION=-
MVSDIAKGFQGNFVATFLFVFTLAQSWFTTGIVFGWPCLLLLLKNEGVYLHKCPPGVTECSDRDVALNLVFTIASIMNVIGVTIGGLFTSPKLSMSLGVVITFVGSLILGLSPSDSDIAWPLAMALQGVSGGMVQLPSYSLGNAFGAAKGCVVACLVFAFIASALIYQFMFFLYKAGMTRKELFLIHTGIEIFFLVFTILWWPSRPIKAGDVLRLSGCRLRLEKEPTSEEPAAQQQQLQDRTAAAAPKAGQLRRVLRAACSVRFLCFLTFYVIELWFGRCLLGWYAPTVAWKNKVLLERTGQGIDIDRHVAIFTTINSLLGMTIIPVFGWVVARFGHRTAPFVGSGFLGIFVVLPLTIPAEWPLYVTCVVGALHRQFLLSTYFNFVTSEFPADIFGKLAGIGTMLSAVAGVTQYPILDATYNVFGGDFVPIYSLMTGMGVFLFIGSVLIFLNEQCWAKGNTLESSEESREVTDEKGHERLAELACKEESSPVRRRRDLEAGDVNEINEDLCEQ